MNEFVWDHANDLGVPQIDKEHQRLFRIINKMIKIKDEEDKDTQWAFEQGITYFHQHSGQHCADEEAYMKSIEYPGIEMHTRAHRTFRDHTLPALEKEIRENFCHETMDHFIGVCAGWLVGHTLTEDMAITGKKDNRFDLVLEGEELDVIKTAVAELVFDLFHLESQLISDMYGGEKFGDGIYYRLSYGDGSRRPKYEVLMAWEEKLLLNTMGKTMGTQSKRVDRFMLHATRYTAQQFVGRVMEAFPDLRHFRLEKENLLTHEQFERIFEREKMQASLLYDTGAGYLSYCVLAPQLLDEAVDISPVSIHNENAMAEIGQYLEEHERISREERKKPKILVVDDSMTSRHLLQNLLSDKYDVSLASSGAGAIRAIVLSRPDLVLLDYEMPVCDGPQILEMMRSDETMQDLPVVFVTGKSDPHSVRRVMSLRPHGYLLKHLKPDQLLEKIEAFLQSAEPVVGTVS